MARESNIHVMLLRTGRTLWDEQRRVQGRTDLPLSDSGRARVASEIKTLMGGHAGRPPAVILAAPDEASLETARMWADTCDAKVRTAAELQSMSLGLWEGLLESEIEHRYPAACREWREQPANIHPPEGESFVDAEMRIRIALTEILERANGRPVAIVSRPIPYAMSVCWLGSRPARDIWTIVESGPDSMSLSIDRGHLHHLCEDLKAGA